MGSSLERKKNIRTLESLGTTTSYQSIGITGDSFCPPDIQNDRQPESYNQDRQYNLHCLYKPSRGTVSTKLSKIAENLWKLCLQRKIHLSAKHIPGILNGMADQASRMKTDRSNWMINPKIFQLINKIWGPF